MARVALTAVALVAFQLPVVAQESRVYAGGAFTLVTQTHSATAPKGSCRSLLDEQSIGGTTRGGTALFGVRVSEHVAVEFEAGFSGSNSCEYTYQPGPSREAHLTASRRDSFFPVQARGRFGVVEPVAGVAIVRTNIGRQATNVGGTPYFSDSRSDRNLALVAGLDLGLDITSSLSLVPTFRVLYVVTGTSPAPFDDPLGRDTSTGPLVVRYGAGLRVGF